MNPDDRLIALVAAHNPVPDPEVLSPNEREAADELRRRIRSGPPPRRGSARRYLLVAAAAVLPVAAVLGLALGIHSLRHLAPAAAAGPPQTILVIGSDHRAGTPFKDVNTDTIMLVRLDPNSKTIKVLSVPRDLKVEIPHGGTTVASKLNAVYFYGGPSLLTKVLQQQVFPGLKVDHVVDFNFAGFEKIIDAIGCVYADIDHRYYNNTAVTNYSSIDIEPGYQKLCGADALSFVRFRHTDSDIVRDARAQDFIRWAKGQFSRDRMLSDEGTLLRIFGENATTDHNLHTTDGVINLFKLVASSLGRPVQPIPFPAIELPCGGTTEPCYITATRTAEDAAYEQFVTPTTAPDAAATSTAPASDSAPPTSKGLVADPADGQSQAAALRGSGLPVYYPRVIRAGSRYCSSSAGNCPLEVADPHAYPRAYRIDAGGRSYPAYRMTLVTRPSLGDYYGVQGTTWTNPPILNRPTRTEIVDGKRLLEFFNGGKLSLVAWKTSGAAYWVSNTLTDSIPAGQLLAIAASLQPAQ
ncbi:MAG TPA: LCP family protein [Solirubrobacteraceae bacterium]|nr:LCP family protein [Solirubrobacteraceae bacterium]